MENVAIIGASELGRQIKNIIDQGTAYQVIGYVDDVKAAGEYIDDCPVLGPVSDIEKLIELGKVDKFSIGIGYNHMTVREELFARLAGKGLLATVIHSSAIVDPGAIIEEGAVIYPGVIIDKDVHIRENVLVNLGCVIAHNTQVDINCYLASNIALGGYSSIGKSCFIGISTSVRDGVKIADHVTTGVGTVVVKNITEPGVYAGCPAQKIS